MPTPEAIDLVGRIRARYKAPGNEHELELIEAAEAIDRFAAQREAGPDREKEWLRRLLLWCRPRLKVSAYMATLDEKVAAGPTDPPSEDEPRIVQSTSAPPQTGGGDAPLSPEAIAHLNAELDAGGSIGPDDVERAVAAYPAGGGVALERPSWEPGWVWDCCIDNNLYSVADVIELRRNVEAALRSSHQEGAEEARQDALMAPFTKALVAEARTQGYREGAEAMRDADARIVEEALGRKHYFALRIRALPIPDNFNKGGMSNGYKAKPRTI